MTESDREAIKKKYKEVEGSRYQMWWKEIDETHYTMGIGKTVAFKAMVKYFDKDDPIPKDMQTQLTETANKVLSIALIGDMPTGFINSFTLEVLSREDAIADLEENMRETTQISYLG